MKQAVLVVEDDEVYRELYSRHLADDYTLHFSDSLHHALETSDTQKPDFILLDMRLPDGNGIAALPKLSKDSAVILCTAYGNEELAVQAMKAGADDYLVKGSLSRKKLRRSMRYAFRKAEIRDFKRSCLQTAGPLEKQRPGSSNRRADLPALVPVCVNCKKIRDAKGLWILVEECLREFVGRDVTHGLCPTCLESELDQIRRDHERELREPTSSDDPPNDTTP